MILEAADAGVARDCLVVHYVAFTPVRRLFTPLGCIEAQNNGDGHHGQRTDGNSGGIAAVPVRFTIDKVLVPLRLNYLFFRCIIGIKFLKTVVPTWNSPVVVGVVVAPSGRALAAEVIHLDLHPLH